MRYYLVIPAAGSGRRFASTQPKQYAALGSSTVIEHALGVFEADADCADVLIQIAAAKGAIHGLMMEVLSGHLAEHVVAEASPTKRAREAQAIVELLQGYAK